MPRRRLPREHALTDQAQAHVLIDNGEDLASLVGMRDPLPDLRVFAPLVSLAAKESQRYTRGLAHTFG